MAAAIQYALNLWPVLLRYCGHGIIEMDNSAAELAPYAVAIYSAITAKYSQNNSRVTMCEYLQFGNVYYEEQQLKNKNFPLGGLINAFLIIMSQFFHECFSNRRREMLKFR